MFEKFTSLFTPKQPKKPQTKRPQVSTEVVCKPVLIRHEQEEPLILEICEISSVSITAKVSGGSGTGLRRIGLAKTNEKLGKTNYMSITNFTWVPEDEVVFDGLNPETKYWLRGARTGEGEYFNAYTETIEVTTKPLIISDNLTVSELLELRESVLAINGSTPQVKEASQNILS